MELKLLEDYLALVEHGSFTRAAEARFVTQPAFSRRIRALENWLGVDLVDRSTYPTQLSQTGRQFAPEISELVRQCYDLRSRLRDHQSDALTLVLATQHSLSVSFFPGWLRSVAPLLREDRIRLNAGNLHDCLDLFLAGQCDLLLCYHSADIYPQLVREDILRLQVGSDRLVPVSGVGVGGRPRYSPVASSRTPLLSYPPESFLGRVLEREQAIEAKHDTFRWMCESALAESLKAMVVQGIGVAWLPASLIASELDSGQLVSLARDLPVAQLNIMLYRHRNARVKATGVFWEYLNELYR